MNTVRLETLPMSKQRAYQRQLLLAHTHVLAGALPPRGRAVRLCEVSAGVPGRLAPADVRELLHKVMLDETFRISWALFQRLHRRAEHHQLRTSVHDREYTGEQQSKQVHATIHE
ncbi:hypothetical protein NDU88_006588 [Pleurodeles waltl]|uniref:Uncharacterized protein n=1 Tax=Pleurodeles waltl TaxID=8319 RepID=A0AAV7SPW8_PLEWA|nr:hypothetical protein NDU88_006588 [Pleurodeles waltl]